MITKELKTEKTIMITYADMYHNLVLKPSALFNFLQDLASENAETLGFGFSATYPNNLGWFLLKYRMEFKDYPEDLKELKIVTEPRGYNKLFAYRNFALFSNEKLLGKVSSTWSLVDLTTKRLMSVEKSISSENLIKHEKREDDLDYAKIPDIQNADMEKEFEIRFDDIDVNGHANNANYIIWAFEPLDFEFRSSRKLKNLDVVFKKEIKFGNKVKSLVQIYGDKTIHLLKNSKTGEELCVIQAEWT